MTGELAVQDRWRYRLWDQTFTEPLYDRYEERPDEGRQHVDEFVTEHRTDYTCSVDPPGEGGWRIRRSWRVCWSSAGVEWFDSRDFLKYLTMPPNLAVGGEQP